MEAAATPLDLIVLTNQPSANISHYPCLSPRDGTFPHTPPVLPCPKHSLFVYSMDYENTNWYFAIGIGNVQPQAVYAHGPFPVAALTVH